jgi:hypothetical protein
MPARGRDRAKDRKFSSALQHILSMVASDGPVGKGRSVRGKRSLRLALAGAGWLWGTLEDPVLGRESTRAPAAIHRVAGSTACRAGFAERRIATYLLRRASTADPWGRHASCRPATI